MIYFWSQNKNRDVIVAFPDVKPSVILNEEKLHKTSGTNNFLLQKLSEKNLDDTSDVTYEKPHLWYSTADVINALRIFLENGDKVSDIPTFRQGIQTFLFCPSIKSQVCYDCMIYISYSNCLPGQVLLFDGTSC